MEKPTNQDPVEWALFNDWVARGGARRAVIEALDETRFADYASDDELKLEALLGVDLEES